MGESITEATIIQWSKQVGDTIEMDETLLEIATDKVDSDIPSPAEGVLVKTFFNADDVVAVGTVIGLISTEADATPDTNKPSEAATMITPQVEITPKGQHEMIAISEVETNVEKAARPSQSQRFYSPLVRSIAAKENIDIATLDNIRGTGTNNRVTKNDILNFVANRKSGAPAVVKPTISTPTIPNIPTEKIAIAEPKKVAKSVSGAMEIIEMDRTRRLIADHMVRSKQTSPHVTSFVEIDVTDIVNWRNQIKGDFKAKHQENITFTPIFIEAVVKAIRDFPLINVSVEGTNILVKKSINGNVMGTPIINQPQVAILSVGKIQKKPAVLETEYGDVIAVRQMMFLSLSYDHRVVDGMLGGSFLRRVGDYLEQFDINQKI